MIERSFVLESRRQWPIRGEVRREESGAAGRIVVISHGFKGFKDWGFFPELGRRLALAGHTAISFNFSGNGVGADPLQFSEPARFRANTLSRELEDLEVVFEAALAGQLEGLPFDDIPAGRSRGPALLGHSRGGMISVIKATRDARVRRLVTWNGVSELERRFPAELRSEWRRVGFTEVVNSRTGQVLEMGLEALDDLEKHLEDYSPVNLASAIDIPWLIVQGREDRTVLFAEGEALERGARRPGVARLHPIAGGDHTLGIIHPYQKSTTQFDEAVRATLEFLAEADPA